MPRAKPRPVFILTPQGPRPAGVISAADVAKFRRDQAAEAAAATRH